MNENINLMEILRDCPKGLRLYSPIYGDVMFAGIKKKGTVNPIIVRQFGKNYVNTFTEDGRILSIPDTECALFPSKELRDWSKFWKNGDILIKDDTPDKIYRFDGYLDKTYMNFRALSLKTDGECSTLTVKGVAPFKLASEDYIMGFFAKLHEVPGEVIDVECVPNDREDEPRQHFNPYDKVLVCDYNDLCWSCGLFSHLDDSGNYICIDGIFDQQCIPYEGNEHLVGTKNSPEHE